MPSDPCPNCGGHHPSPDERDEMLDLANDISKLIKDYIPAERTKDGPTVVGALLYLAALTVSGCPHEKTRKAIISDVRKSFGPLVDNMIQDYAKSLPQRGETFH